MATASGCWDCLAGEVLFLLRQFRFLDTLGKGAKSSHHGRKSDAVTHLHWNQCGVQTAICARVSRRGHHSSWSGDPNGIRTRVTPVKGECPRPLDDRVAI